MVARENRLLGPVMEQPQYNMFHREKVEVEFNRLYQTVGLGTTIWSPLASGVLTDKYLNEFPEGTRMSMEGLDWLRERNVTPERLETVGKLNRLALDHGTTLAKFALAWCLKNRHVTTVILGASRTAQLQENLHALDVMPLLTPKVMDEVEEILGNKPE
jgi:aryl-alcohol dehydrogenase-like predicted oxidoreductase